MRMRAASLQKCTSRTAIALAMSIATLNGITSDRASAQTDVGQVKNFNIPAGDLDKALGIFASQTSSQMVYSTPVIQNRTTSGVAGAMSERQALFQILANTGLRFRYNEDRTIVIEAEPQSVNGERVLGAVRVEGSQGLALDGATLANGINGSRDVTATEGTGSYTSNALTIGTKAAASLKDTPMTLSVLSDQRLKDQAITDYRTALEQAPGITVQTGTDSLSPRFYSRGFEIKTIQIDGGPGLQTYNGTVNTEAFRPLIDLSLYDHVEILRGAAGAFNGYGDPGGVVNLVRKKPLDHTQFTIELEGGSWEKYRVVADVTGPLAIGGSLRGRMVLTTQTNNHFYDVAKDLKNIAYGVLDLDITPTTLLTVGASYQIQNGVPWSSGLMRYDNGEDLKLPRSTCLCFDWAHTDTNSTEFFAQIDQKIGGDWGLKLKTTRIIQEISQQIPIISRAVRPGTQEGPIIDYGRGMLYEPRSKQSLYEVTLNGSFLALGNSQKITLGANLALDEPKGSKTHYFLNGDLYALNIPVNIFTYTPRSVASELLDEAVAFTDLGGKTSYLTTYINFNLMPFKKMHVITSLRYSKYIYQSSYQDLCNQVFVYYGVCTAEQIGQNLHFFQDSRRSGDDLSWPPSVSLQYDLTDTTTLYGTYADIYRDQSTYLTEARSPIGPLRGANYEGGVKWAARDGRINAALSGFYTKQSGGPLAYCGPDFNGEFCETEQVDDIGSADFSFQRYCCFINDPTSIVSYGGDLEISGEIRRNLQLSLGYTYNITKNNGDKRPDGTPKAYSSFTPKHLYKIWFSYQFSQESKFSGLRVAGGVNGQTSTYISGFACTAYSPPRPSGFRFCTDGHDYDFTDPGRAIISTNIQYDLSKQFNISLNLENIFDKIYYQTVGDANSGNWYGAPRSFTLTLRAKI